MSEPASKAMAIHVCKLASDLVATITLMKNAPVNQPSLNHRNGVGRATGLWNRPHPRASRSRCQVHGEGVV